MAPLAGITGITPGKAPPQTGRDPEEWGTPPDKRHSTPGDAKGLPVKGGQYAQDPGLPPESLRLTGPAGRVRDKTPNVHAAPYPRGIETDPVLAQEASAILHGDDLGGMAFLFDGAVPYGVEVDSGFTDSPNASIQATPPAQLRDGSRDEAQGEGRTNSGTFNVGHQARRIYKDPVPMDRSTLLGGERPFFGRYRNAQARFDGPGSPYGLQGDTSTGMSLAPQDVGFATPYVQPADPAIATGGYGTEGASIGADWVGG